MNFHQQVERIIIDDILSKFKRWQIQRIYHKNDENDYGFIEGYVLVQPFNFNVNVVDDFQHDTLHM